MRFISDSGVSDTRVLVYDYVNQQEYQLSSRMCYDYNLTMKDGIVMVTQSEYRLGKKLSTAALQLENDKIVGFDNARTKDVD